MTNAKHTPGPWHYTAGHYVPDVYAVVEGDRRKSVIGEDMTEANARLIAAAPELLAALINCRDALRRLALESNHPFAKHCLGVADTASLIIAKAEGEK